MASSLNINYLDGAVELLNKNVEDRRPLVKLVRDNEVGVALKSMGYKIVSFDSGFESTLSNADYYMSPERPVVKYRLNAFELSLLNLSMLRELTSVRTIARC